MGGWDPAATQDPADVEAPMLWQGRPVAVTALVVDWTLANESRPDRTSTSVGVSREDVLMSLTVLDAIGHTPIVRLVPAPPGAAEIWVKLEAHNPTGSYKDRMALAMIEGAEREGLLRPGQTVVEYTGGSTGTSLALCARSRVIRCGLSPRTRSLPRSWPRCARSARGWR